MDDPAKLREYLERVTLDLRKARGRIEDLERQEVEPIAIVGMACRYPGGVGSPAQLWQLVAGGGDGVSEFPTDRGWDLERLYDPDREVGAARLTSYTREGGFLAGAGDFDAEFFGISPREALATDPQQRLLLESCWEALEDAGIDPEELAETQAGVFAGVMYQDYGETAGMSQSLVSGRVAYTLGLEGPAMTIDTACSSSLVAMHLAAQALRSGECSLALAGGVTVLSTPGAFVEFSRQRGLAPDGRCKSFAEAADGVGWSEGVGVLVLERLSEAQRNGHPVLATIRGSAVNQDGASNGISAPNGPSQVRVIRQALASAGLSAAEVDVVEAHGTGTTLGDPIEAGALLATYGAERGENGPLRLGSLKSNIGHTQAAAGVGGVIKMVEALRHGALPKTLHVDAPSNHVDWSAGAVELLTEQRPWQAGEHPRRAGISSFGISGTNAHLIVEEAPGRDGGDDFEAGPDAVPCGAFALPLSAKTEPALCEAAARLAAQLRENPELDPADAGFSLATTRALFERRAVVVGADREQLLTGLDALGRGEAAASAISAKARAGKLAYLFTGQGSQRAGMGAELHGAYPAYAEAFDRVCAAIDPELGESLAELVLSTDPVQAERLDHTTYAQPALFAIEVALFELLRSFGLSPDLLAGHSIGEITAAHVAGVLSLEDAAKLVVARGRLMGELPAGGAMVALEGSEAEVAEALEGKEAELSLAAINSPSSIVVSGTQAAIDAIEAAWREKDRKTKRLAVSHAFHSALMEPMLAEFEQLANSLTYNEPQIPIVSNLSGELLDPAEATDPGYWVRHVREPVRFADGIAALAKQGATTFVELGPDAVLSALGPQCLADDAEASFVPTLREGREEPAAIVGALASAHAHGASVEWSALYPGAKRVGLPTYPFQRERFWLSSGLAGADPSATGQAPADHPLLGAEIELPGDQGWLFTGRLSLQSHPWLADHAVAGTVLLPGTAFVELALHAGQRAGADAIEELTLQAPLILSEAGSIQLQVRLVEGDEQGAQAITISSRPEGADGGEGAEWTDHAAGILRVGQTESPEPLEGAWPPPGAEPIDPGGAAYERLAELGFDYGPVFQGLRGAWRVGEEIYAEAALTEEQGEGAARFGLHPALLDSALHAGILAGLQAEVDPVLRLPFSWSGVALHASGAADLRVRISSTSAEELVVTAFDSSGSPVASIASLRGRAVDPAQLQAVAGAERSLFGLAWTSLALQSPNGSAPNLAFLGDLALTGIEAERHADLAALLAAIEAGAEPPAVLLVGPGTLPEEVPTAAQAEALRLLSLLQDALAAESLAETRLVYLAERALATTEEESPDLRLAPAFGLLRSASSEHPGRFGAVDHDGTEASLAALPAALLSAEPQLALREGVVLAPRLTRAVAAEQAGAVMDPEATVLVTGATGGIGALVARHLVEAHGARQLLLVSRRGAAGAGAAELQGELEGLGATVEIAACDVAEREQLAELLGAIDPEHPLGAVIHSAGVLDDGVIEALSPERIERVFAPKVDAAWHLHELTKDLDLSHFVLFSSVAGLLGGAAQGNYAAANAFLDALAVQRQAQGLAGTSLAWGFWGQRTDMGRADLGAPERAQIAEQIRERLGLAPLTPQRGLELFDAATALPDALLVPAQLDTAALRRMAKGGMLAPLLSGLVRMPARRAATGSLAAKLAAVAEPERQAMVLDLVRSQVAAVLGHGSAEAVDAEKPFKDLGFDSLAAVELRNRLAAATGMSLPATLVFDYPSCQGLAEHLLGAVTGSAVARRAVVRAQTSEEPIAIVGMACRYPGGVSSPDQLWQLVAEGRDGISEFPADRDWDLEHLFHPDPDNPGTSYSREGGFIAGAGDFDPAFFGISPREAPAMDPQQRLLLESCWEALEDAGVDPALLAGTDTGVFAGVMHHDYGWLQGPIPAAFEDKLATGGTSSIVSGRVAYTLGLEGPAMTVDTACSSSLVSLHLAAQALRSGECSLALAGGVTVLAKPAIFVQFSRMRGLAPDGRCKSFAESADGTGFAEGVGVLALERLSEAERNGHPILATIRGSAVNQDGASNGITAPNGLSQERVIRQALANAGLEAKDIDVVEAHGTGTTLGDPIEAGALLATYGQERPDGRPLQLGSLKSNIGHTQAAAGVGGVIKMVEALRHGALPKTLHVDAPSNHVDWSAGAVELLTEQRPWQPNGAPRRAGISSFGATGTNAHLILEEAPQLEVVAGAAESPLAGAFALPLSARGEPALREMAARLATHLGENPELDPADAGFSLATTRALFERRAVVVGADREQLLTGLDALARGEASAGTASSAARTGKLAYLFTGQGAQRAGMGAELYASSPLFAAALDEVCGKLDAHLARPLRELLFATEGSPEAALLDRTEFTQPALFAIEVALFELLGSLGLSPDLLAGHSIGEISAAHVAGVLSLEDAAKLVVARGRLMGELPAGGAMVALEGSEAEVAEALEGNEAELSLAAINSPTSIVVSGTEAAIDAIEASWREKDRKTKRLTVSHAFHSALMEPMLAEFEQVARSLSYKEPQIPIVSNLSGELLDPADATDPAYWVRHVREPVRLADGVAALTKLGATTFVELGPDPVLSALGPQCLADDATASFIPTLREGREEPAAIVGALASAHAHGAKVEWSALYPGAKKVGLPTYPFQRERFWLSSGLAGADPTATGQAPADHPLLGAEIELPDDEGWLFTGRLSLQSHPWLADHAVAGTVLLPGTAFLELAFCAAGRCGAAQVAELTLETPLRIAESESIALRVSVSGPDESGERAISIHSRSSQAAEDGEPAQWSRHASGALGEEPTPAAEPLTSWPPPGAEEVDIADFYPRLADLGFEYGPAFQGLTKAWSDGEEIYAEVSLAPEQREEASGYALHPALTDAALHAGILAALLGEDSVPTLRLPFSWRQVSLPETGGAAFARLELGVNGEEISLRLADQDGKPLAAVGSLATREVSAAALGRAPSASGLFTVSWREFAARSGGGIDAPEPANSKPEIRELTLDASLSPSEAARQVAAEALALLQGWLGDDESAPALLAICTEGAVAVSEDESPDPAAAAIWGLVRSAQAEHPGRFVLIDSDGSEASREVLPSALETDEPQLALREGRLLVARAERIASNERSTGRPLTFEPERTVLITGATGGLGAFFASHLVKEHGARHLLLISRSGAEAEGAAELQAELEELGAEARIAACDVADRGQLQELLASIDSAHPLGAVIYAAGTLDDATIDSMSVEQLASVFPAKVDGALALHELTAAMDLSAFILFSSIAGTLGGPGQGNYAAANAFLDALAQQRRVEGLPAISIAWGLWQRQSAMTAKLGEADLARMGRIGIEPIGDQQGVELFDGALSGERALTVAVPLDLARLRSLAATGALLPLLGGLVRVPARRQTGSAGSLGARLAELPGDERPKAVLEAILAEVATVLGHDSDAATEPDRAFKEMGFDSLAAVELRNGLAATTGLTLQPTLVFDYPTPALLATYLLEQISEETDGGPVLESKEREIRAALASIPLAHLRRAGLMDSLLQLADSGGDAKPEQAVDGEAIDEMDLESLIRQSTDATATASPGEGI